MRKVLDIACALAAARTAGSFLDRGLLKAEDLSREFDWNLRFEWPAPGR